MSILDTVTGETIATVGETQGTREILVSDGIAIAYTRQETSGVKRRRGAKDIAGAALVAVDARTLKVIWQKRTVQIRPLSIAIDNGRIVYISEKNLVLKT